NNSLFAGFGANDAINVTVTKGLLSRQGNVALLANTIALVNQAGDVGTKKLPLLTDAINLTVSGTNVFLSESNGVNLGTSGATSTFQVVTNGNTVVTGDVSAAKVDITTNGGTLGIGANINGTKKPGDFKGSISLDAEFGIFQTTRQLTAQAVTLTEDNDIGVNASRFIVSSGDVTKAVTLVAAATVLNSNIFVGSTSPVTVKSASADGTVDIQSCGSVTVNSPITTDNVAFATSPGVAGN